MRNYTIKSFAKINISLGVLKKLKSKFHKIESLVSLIDLYDIIKIEPSKSKKHKVIFTGLYSKKIKKKDNTVTKLLSILDSEKLLKRKKYKIIIKKNIPIEAGLGGGSLNAASILNFFLNQKIIPYKKKKILHISRKIGSDVLIGIEKKNSFNYENFNIVKLNKKIKFNLILIKPNFGCKTKKIYSNVKMYSKPKLNINLSKIYNSSYINTLSNDLEIPAFNKYPRLYTLKKDMLKLPNVFMARMTGSGSTLVSYFISKKASLNAAKILRRKYKNYWCIVSKTI